MSDEANTMSKILTAAAATAALLFAAPVAQASPFEFAGFYAGAHAGYLDASADFNSGDLDEDGTIGGLQAGYNFINGNLMYGVELDFSLTNASPDGACPNNPGLSCEVESGPMGTLRARLGYARDDWMVYVTGGAAASQFELETNGSNGSDSGLHGWTIGAGGEYLLGDIVGVKLEYRYLQFGDFGGFDEKLKDPSGAKIDVDMHVIMGGINFHF
jgi:outer membrane immunogenic protein